MSIPKIYSIINNICWQIVMWCSSLIRKRQFIWRKKKWKALTDIVNFTLNLKLEMCDENTAKWIEAKARNTYFHWSLTLSNRFFFYWQLRFLQSHHRNNSMEKTSRTLEMNCPKGKRFTKHWSKLKTYLSYYFFKPRVYLYFHLIHKYDFVIIWIAYTCMLRSNNSSKQLYLKIKL